MDWIGMVIKYLTIKNIPMFFFWKWINCINNFDVQLRKMNNFHNRFTITCSKWDLSQLVTNHRSLIVSFSNLGLTNYSYMIYLYRPRKGHWPSYNLRHFPMTPTPFNLILKIIFLISNLQNTCQQLVLNWSLHLKKDSSEFFRHRVV